MPRQIAETRTLGLYRTYRGTYRGLYFRLQGSITGRCTYRGLHFGHQGSITRIQGCILNIRDLSQANGRIEGCVLDFRFNARRQSFGRLYVVVVVFKFCMFRRFSQDDVRIEGCILDIRALSHVWRVVIQTLGFYRRPMYVQRVVFSSQVELTTLLLHLYLYVWFGCKA